MGMRRTIFGVCLFYLCFPPNCLPASSDAFPWGNQPDNSDTAVKRDNYGALRDASMLPDSLSTPAATPSQPSVNNTGLRLGDVVPGSSANSTGVAQGNVGPTQSGPGAAALFTPNSPGNAAAYSAQMKGGLQGSPIVDGNGTNLQIAVPVSTPSMTTEYQRVTNNGASVAPKSGSAYGGVESTQNLQPALNRQVSSSGSSALPSFKRIGSFRAPVNADIDRVRMPDPNHPQTSQQALNLIGRTTGSLRYGDGELVVFGTDGTLRVRPGKQNLLTLANGRVLPIQLAPGAAMQIAKRTQFSM